MAMETGDLTTLAEAVDSKTIFGAPDLNPNDIRNTCVSVALAYMDNHRTIEELWHALRPSQPIPTTGLDFRRALKLMEETGWTYKWVYFASSGTRRSWAYDDLVEYLSTARHPPFADTLMVLYKRHGRGHAINLEYGNVPMTKVEDAWRKREWREFWHFSDFSVEGARADEEAVIKDLKPAIDIFVLRRDVVVAGKNAGELYDQWKKRGTQIGRVKLWQ